MTFHRGIYHHVKHHVRHHKKRYLRFIAFFTFLMVFAIIEDSIVAIVSGAPLNVYTFIIILIIATTFTAISEITEEIAEKPRVKKFIKREEKIVGKEMRREKRFIKKELKKI